jgi:small subunit ribosomal protein S3
MSKIVHPYAHRLGITKDWKSRWFSINREYSKNLKADIIVREFLEKKLRGSYVSQLDIERNQKFLKIIIKSSRPGMIIGRSGEGINKLRADIIKKIGQFMTKGQDLKIDIEEVKSPESHAAIVSYMVAEALEKRMPYRRVLKQTLEKIMANRDVLGCRIRVGGRLGGADMARTEEMKRGRIPLQTIRADISYHREKAHMTYGDLGIKVWIYRGEIFNKKDKK